METSLVSFWCLEQPGRGGLDLPKTALFSSRIDSAIGYSDITLEMWLNDGLYIRYSAENYMIFKVLTVHVACMLRSTLTQSIL